jgi:hypothetical protein
MLSARQMLKLVVLAAIVAAFLAPSVMAAEKADPNSAAGAVTLKGVVTAVEDANGVVLGVKLTTADNVIYMVELNNIGKKLGKEMNGKEVEVTGVVSEKNIKVSSFKAVVKNAK